MYNHIYDCICSYTYAYTGDNKIEKTVLQSDIVAGIETTSRGDYPYNYAWEGQAEEGEGEKVSYMYDIYIYEYINMCMCICMYLYI
jgi:hypothetical protein